MICFVFFPGCVNRAIFLFIYFFLIFVFGCALAIPGLLLFERSSGTRADGVGCSDGGTVCDRFVIGL